MDQVNAIKVPAAWECAEDDISFPTKFRQEAEAAFAARKKIANSVEYEFKDYKGTAHGFAARPNLGIPEIKDAFEKAFQQTVDWFNHTLTV